MQCKGIVKQQQQQLISGIKPRK